MSRPAISVVVPTHERRETLARVLRAWSDQTPGELQFEVVIVDDGSKDGTAEWLATARFDRFALRTAGQENRGPAAARNRALELASGDLVLFSGDDIEPAPSLLAEHLAAHREAGDRRVAIVGRIDWPEQLGTTATMRHITGRGAQQFSFHYMNDGAEYDFRHFYTSNVSVSRWLLAQEPAGFSTAFPHAAFEDAELAFRLVRHGMRIRYRSAAQAWHWHRYGARGFFERQLRCGEMAQRLARMHPTTGPLLGVRELDRLRSVSFLVATFGRGRLRSLAAELPGRIARVVELAERHDAGDDRDAEPLLLALFGFAYRAGLARARYAVPTACRIEASLYARELAAFGSAG